MPTDSDAAKVGSVVVCSAYAAPATLRHPAATSYTRENRRGTVSAACRLYALIVRLTIRLLQHCSVGTANRLSVPAASLSAIRLYSWRSKRMMKQETIQPNLPPANPDIRQPPGCPMDHTAGRMPHQPSSHSTPKPRHSYTATLKTIIPPFISYSFAATSFFETKQQ